MTDLEFVTTEELLDELKKRNEVCLFVSLTDLTEEVERMQFAWQGGATIMLGLLTRVRRKILRHLN